MSEEDVRDVISKIEFERIQLRQFMLNLNGEDVPSFVTNVDVEKKLPGLSSNDIIEWMRNLREDEFIIFDSLFGTEYQTDNPDVEVIARSRIFHTIWCLSKSVNITKRGNSRDPNVGDFKYIKKIKRIPARNHPLDDIFVDEKINEILGGKKDQVSGKVTAPNTTIRNIIQHLINEANDTTIDFNKSMMSDFQKECTEKTLKALDDPKNSTGLVFVAGTGFGKTFAYELPIMLWILMKKIKKWEEYRSTSPIDESILKINCAMLLVMPRTSLAIDQNKSILQIQNSINRWLDSHIADNTQSEFLKFKKPLLDISGQGAESKWIEDQEIIILHPSSLENRLLNPDCHSVFSKGIDLILFDEVHTHESIGGTNVAAINARLKAILPKKPVFIGMSATIDKPDLHCQKLFASISNDKPDIIEQNSESPTIPFTLEHHLMFKPASGRNLDGVAIELTSCLLHNRRNGFTALHDDQNGGNSVNTEQKEKTITFINSLEGSQNYLEDLNDYEEYFGNNKFGGDSGLAKPLEAASIPNRKYFYYCKPKEGQSYTPSTGSFTESCDTCQSRQRPDLLDCNYYKMGDCWYFSQDDSNQFNQQGRWEPRFIPTKGSHPQTWLPFDNIRSKRASSQEDKPTDIASFFLDQRDIRDGFKRNGSWHWQSTNDIEIDNVVSTPTLEVGVDFDNVTEIIQIGSVLSVSSYKQKVGRGARQGDLSKGLVAMSVIDQTPTSYFYFKHFDNLIGPNSLDPLKLEITNVTITETHSYLSIFDFLAKKNVKLYRIVNNSILMTSQEIEDEIQKATQILNGNEIKDHVRDFLKQMGFPNKNPDDVIDYTKNFLARMNEKYNVNGDKFSLYEMLVRSSKDQVDFDRFYSIMAGDTSVEKNVAKNAVTELQELCRTYGDEMTDTINALREEL